MGDVIDFSRLHSSPPDDPRRLRLGPWWVEGDDGEPVMLPGVYAVRKLPSPRLPPTALIVRPFPGEERAAEQSVGRMRRVLGSEEIYLVRWGV